MTVATSGRFLMRRLAFTGPRVPSVELPFVDGLNVVWGASNTGKSYAVKAMDFMSGGKDPLPDITEAKGYDRAWLQWDLPESGAATLSRSLAKGGYSLHGANGFVGTSAKPERSLKLKHDAKTGSLSQFLLSELGIRLPVDIVANDVGAKNAFTFRHFAHYLFTEETDMMAPWSPVRLAAKSPEAFNRNVLKYLLTGIDGSSVVEVPSVEAQKGANAGKLDLLQEMASLARRELERRFPDHDDLDDQSARLDKTISGLAVERRDRQDAIDKRRRERRHAFDAAIEADEKRAEVGVMLDRFESLLEIYESDIGRLEALDEGGAALLAGAKRDCPLCGADPAYQVHSHGHAEIEGTRNAVRAEIAKILSERRDLIATMASLRVDYEALGRVSKRHEADVVACDGDLVELLPKEADSQGEYERLHAARMTILDGIALKDRIADFDDRIAELERFKPRKPPRGSVEVGVSGTVGHALAKTVQAVLHAWRFPGAPDVSFDQRTHDIQLDGKARNSNGKGVRALMNAAFKIGLLQYCRDNGFPHPGVIVLDSPLLSYRDPVTSKHGDLSEDERTVKHAGVHVHFYE